jgi:hypothetical protein
LTAVKKSRFAFWLNSETEEEIRERFDQVMKLLDLESTGDDGHPHSDSELRSVMGAIGATLSGIDPDNSNTWKIGVRMIPHVNALVECVDKRGGFCSLGNDNDRLVYARILCRSTKRHWRSSVRFAEQTPRIA